MDFNLVNQIFNLSTYFFLVDFLVDFHIYLFVQYGTYCSMERTLNGYCKRTVYLVSWYQITFIFVY
jgi:hypothetical protein